ncbi:zf-CCHC domain-containing protein [Tanacetum coccineum]
MTTLAEHIIVVGAENHPPMLEKSMYDSWASLIRLFIKGKKNGRMMLDSIDNGPLVYPTVEENGFSQLINDMHTIGMKMQQVQVNTTFLNALLPEWSKFVTDVKLAKSLYTTNYDQLYAYLSQHERHANKSFTSTGNKGIATTSRGNYAAGQAKVVKCYNCLGEGHMAKQCTQPKRPRSSAWFKEKLMLAEAQEAGQILDEEQLAFIAKPGTEDLDTYDSDCDDISSAKAVLMENLLSCDSDVLSEEIQNAGIQDTNSSTPNDLLVLSLVEQMTVHVANLDKENQTNKMVNESLTAELERYKERVAIFEQRLNVDLNKHEKLIDSQMDDLIQNRNAKFAAFQQEIDTLKETLSNRVKEKESLSTT